MNVLLLPLIIISNCYNFESLEPSEEIESFFSASARSCPEYLCSFEFNELSYAPSYSFEYSSDSCDLSSIFQKTNSSLEISSSTKTYNFSSLDVIEPVSISIYSSLAFSDDVDHIISSASGSNGSANFNLIFTAEAEHDYFIKISYCSNFSYSPFIMNVSILHSHNYSNSYLYNDNSTHKAFCECGVFQIRPHTVRQNDIITIRGRSSAPCLFCGRIINLDSGNVIVGPNCYSLYPHSANGSYILPSGNIVLVEADIELYLEGSLEFSTNSDLIL